MTDVALEGGCQCGSVRYRIVGPALVTALCHCTICRRASAAPAVAWAMYKEEQVSFLADQPKPYASSPEATRGFCGRCGTQISFAASYIPGLVDITIGSLDNPNALAPTFHYWYAEHLEWVQFDDGLPRYPEFPPISQ